MIRPRPVAAASLEVAAPADRPPQRVLGSPLDVAVADSARSRLPIRLCLGYGVGTVGVSILLNAVSTFYTPLMTTILGRSPQLAGYLLMLSKLYDAVVDVVLGSLSDRTRSRWGRRRPYLLAGGAVSAVAFFIIFSPPHLGETQLIIYMMAALMLYSTGYSLFNVPYVAMASEMTDDFHDRTRLWSFRTVFVSIGQLLSLAGTAALIKYNGGGAHGYAVMGLILALVIMTAMVTSFYGTVDARRIEPSSRPRVRVREQLALLGSNRHFVFLMGAKIFQFLAFASTAGTIVLFMLNVLKVGYSGQIEMAIAQNAATALGMPLWLRIARRFGKNAAYMSGVTIYIAAMLSWLQAGADIGYAGLVSRGIVGGFGSAGMILMSMSMLSDTMAYDRYHSGMHREGLYASIVAVLEKTSYAAGVALIGIYLDSSGYIPTTQGALVAQPATAINALYAGIALIPAVFFIGNLACIYCYRLDATVLQAAEATRAAATTQTADQPGSSG